MKNKILLLIALITLVLGLASCTELPSVDNTPTYEVTWVVGENELNETYKEGETPYFKFSTNIPSDDKYSYVFVGWDKTIKKVTKDITYTAVYTKTEIKVEGTYTVSWKIGDNVFAEAYKEGEIPTFKYSTNRESDGVYVYTFTGWDKEITSVVADVTYTALYSQREIEPDLGPLCNVTWVVDGVSVREEYHLGQTPVYKSGIPTKETDEACSYVFIGWDKELIPLTGDVVFTAKFEKQYLKYEVTLVANGKEITDTYYYGAIPTLGFVPTKDYDDNYVYKFAGWKDVDTNVLYSSLPQITKNAKFTAHFDAIERWDGVKINQYNIDGTFIGSTIASAEFGKVYTVNAPLVSGYVASHDYVSGVVGVNEEVSIYYSKLSVWDGSSASTSLSGNGTQTNPYLIQSANDLAYVKNKASSFGGKYLKMMVSVDVNNTNFMIKSFAGHFDGNNCTIRNVNISNTAENTGLFDVVSGGNSISNVSVYGKVSGAKKTAGIVGYAGANITNCTNYATVTGSVGNVAGIVGCVTVNSKGVKNCNNYGTISNTSWNTGGVVGLADTVVADCNNYGNVSTTTDCAGGVVGTTHSPIVNCNNYGSVSGKQNLGGIVFSSNNTVANCINYGTVSTTTTASTATQVGGIAATSAEVSSCVNYGKVSGYRYVGGISAVNSAGVTDCQNYGIVTGSAGEIAGIVGKASGEIKKCTNNSTGTVTGGGWSVGGIAGISNASISGCSNYASIKGTGGGVGGIVGELARDLNIKAYDCHNNGSVAGKEVTGGIVGYLRNNKVEECTNDGNVTGTAEQIGGIVGQLDSGFVYNSSNSGTVYSPSNRIGGIVGQALGSDINAIRIEGCENTGSINGNSYVGGITGTSQTLSIKSCVNSGMIEALSSYAGGILGCVITDKNTAIYECSNFGNVNTESYAGCIAGGCIKDTCSLSVKDCENDSTRISVIGNAIGNITVENMNNVPFVEDEEVITVLMLSNSFGDDTRQWVHEIAKEYDVKINVANLYIGGCVLERHLENLVNDAAAYEFRYYENGTWNNQTGTKISDALGYQNWDYVMLQQGSSQSGVADKYSTIDEIMDRILAINGNVKFFWNMTWAYQQDSGHSSFGTYNNNQITMYNGIINAVQTKVLTNDRIEFVVPNGTAVQNARTSYIGDNLCRDKYCHLTNYFGRYIAALTFFSKVTGIDISDITYSPGLTDYDRTIAIESVQNALANPYTITNSKYRGEETRDFSNYMKINWEPTVSAYWYSSTSLELVSAASNSPNFVASKKFSKAELPVGTVIEIKDGYQYRPDGWVSIDTLLTGDRPGNVSTKYIVVTEEWWGNFTYRGFNVSAVGGGSIVDKADEAIAAFNIYIPLEISGYTKLDWQPAELAFWNSSDSNMYNKLISGSALAQKFVSSGVRFTKEDIPVGSIIVVASGYRYRPDAWLSDSAQSGATRPDNVTTSFVTVTEEWWGDYIYRAFNVSATNGAVLTDCVDEAIAAFNIYIPKK